MTKFFKPLAAKYFRYLGLGYSKEMDVNIKKTAYNTMSELRLLRAVLVDECVCRDFQNCLLGCTAV
jgi:hypothetical protein